MPPKGDKHSSEMDPLQRRMADFATALAHPDSRRNRGRWRNRRGSQSWCFQSVSRQNRCAVRMRLSETGCPRGSEAMQLRSQPVQDCPTERTTGGFAHRSSPDDFRLPFGGHQSPGQAEVERQIGSYAPIILDEGTEQFPAATDRASDERLIVSGKGSQATEKEISHVVASRSAGLGDKPSWNALFLMFICSSEWSLRTGCRVCPNQVERVRKGETLVPPW